ncbi:MAG: M50 family metallopeptidase [Planctomycetes bacterium]|nr:M50 family metallopeptidase [Planctomycetota bacterium]
MLPATMDQAGRFYLGHIGKVPIYAAFDAIFLVIFVFLFVGAGMSIDQILLVVIALVLTVLLHELGHALVAMAVGMSGVSITITGLGGLCSYTGERHPKQELLISAAGPATNLLVAWVTWAFLSNGMPSDETLRFLLGWFWMWNLWLGIFNSLPIFPLDGGQMALSISRMLGREHTARRFTLGLSFVTAFVAVGAYMVMSPGNLPIFLILMVMFLLYTAYRELR